MNDWYVYIVECCDHTFYTGMARNVDARIEKHNLGKGAKYTRGRTPVVLQYAETLANKSLALKREHQIKQLSKVQKQGLIDTYQSSLLSE